MGRGTDRDRLELPRRQRGGVTRYLVGNADPITLAILRWGIGFVCLLPVALVLRVKWPPRRDWPAVALLGLCFFGLFFVLYNIAMSFTTAARASLALSTLPLQTMVVGALLGIEPLTVRKSAGVCIAVLGVFAALASGLSAAPPGAWRGELIMTGAVLCMAFYNVLVAPIHPAIERARLPDRRHGGRRGGAGPGGSLTGRVAVLAASARRNGSPAFISASAAARSPSSCGCWRCSGPRRRASPTP